MKLYIVSIATYSECCLEPFKPLIAKSFEEAVELMTNDVNSYRKGMEDEIFAYDIDKENGTAFIVWDDDTKYEYEIFEAEVEI